MRPLSTSLVFTSFLIATISVNSYANGLQDLQQALAKLNQSADFTATVNTSLKNEKKDGDANAIKEGNIHFIVEQDQSGLKIQYPNDLLQSVGKENLLKKQNPATPTPTTDTLNRFNYSEISILFNPVRDIEADLRKAKFVKEEAVSLQGNPARLLHLYIPLEGLEEEERKHLKKYRTDLKIWINDQGIPLASQSIGKGSGRFALVIGFEFNFDVEKTYITYNNRLLVARLTSQSGNKGGGTDEKETINANLELRNLTRL